MSDYLHAKTENVQKLLDDSLKKQMIELIEEEEKRFDEFAEVLLNLEHWPMEGLEIVPRNLIIKAIKRQKQKNF